MQKFVRVHPVIYKIEAKKNNDYLVHEKLKLLFIPVSFTYPVTVESDAVTRKIKMKAVVKKMTEVEMNFAIKVENGKTIVDEEIIFKSKLPVKFIMKGVFKKQHLKLFKNIENSINEVDAIAITSL
jgi:hypothetical protein